MNYTIENEYLKVEVADRGAEMQSLIGKKSGFEYLWQGDSTYWGNRATVLFPICGRLFEGKYTWKDKTYEMVLHGFAKLSTFTVVEHKTDEITFELRASEETRACYPFDFILRMTYTLDGATVRTGFYVENPSEEDLPFSVGGHPGFNVPFCAGETFEDYTLAFGCEKPAERMLCSAACLNTGRKERYPLRDGKYIDLRHDMFDDDAIFLTNMCKKVSLCSQKNDRSVTVHFEDMVYLGLWHKPHTEAPYICIEPWHGFPAYDGKTDDFATKFEMMHLEKGASYSTWFDITVTE